MYILEISKEYEMYIKQSNKEYIKENILCIRKTKKEMLIKYLDITKEELGKLGIKEIIVMAIGFIVGGSFVDGGKLSFSNLSTTTFYVFTLFLASSIFYFIILKIVNNYKLIMNDNAKKKELLINILEIEYEY